MTGTLHHGDKARAFIDIHQYPHDSNLTCNVIAQALIERYPTGKAPPFLNIQMDNCGRENKNRFVFGWAGLAVAKGLFKEIELAFLMTGHTHDGR